MQVQSKGLVEETNSTRPKSGNAAPIGDEVSKIRELAEEFESIFLNMMLQSMRQAVQESDLLKKSNGEDIFQSMLDSEYAKEMALQRISGISDAVESQLLGAMTLPKQTINEIRGFTVYQNLDCIPLENKGE